ncbi:MAG: NADH-ubiquinone oxidoreductase-F iron-sulfur binding region domain-containing protein [Acutalibacter sp.]
MFRSNVLVCGGTGCTSSNSEQIIEKLQEEIKAQGLEKEVNVIRTGCFGLCALGPIMVVYPEGAFYSRVTVEDVPEIVSEHLLKGRIVKRLLYQETVVDDNTTKSLNETTFYAKQMRIALRNCGVINPENIDEYIAQDGYAALGKVLTEMTPQEVIDLVLASGLRGRGGAGFPTGRKWQFAANSKAEQKYACCNADEGDPGAFMDRSVLEGDPHSVLEAMAIAGYAIGANQGYIYIRAEYPIAVKRLQIAIEQAREYGLGKNIFDSGLTLTSTSAWAPAPSSAARKPLDDSIEGKRGEPQSVLPLPAVKGLFGVPTVRTTWRPTPTSQIISGADWFRSIGTEKSPVPRCSPWAKITNTGLVEVPMGTTLREVVEEIGGGVPGGHTFKAAQTGGPSGGCIPAKLIDTPIDYDNLIAIGSMMGSGGLIVMDETTCMVDIAKFFLEFTVDESCGKCTPCRVGTKRLLEILNKITSGNGTLEDIDKMEELCYYIKENSLCGLGQTAPNPVLSTLKYYRDEYEAHVVEHRCPAGACKALTNYSIIADKCKGCTLCARNCPVGAISGSVKQPHVIDTTKCIKCGVCMEKCKFGAVVRK